MWKLFILSVSIFICIEKVNSFTCYISESRHNSKSGYLNRSDKIKDCSERNLLRLPIFLPQNGPISCFKIVGTDPNGNVQALKGCIETGKCDELITKYVSNGTKINQDGVYLSEDSQCFECEEENCNVAAKLRSVDVLSVTVLSLIYFLV